MVFFPEYGGCVLKPAVQQSQLHACYYPSTDYKIPLTTSCLFACLDVVISVQSIFNPIRNLSACS